MVFPGLADKEHESSDECQILVVHLLDEHMGLTNVQIERAHRSASTKTKKDLQQLQLKSLQMFCRTRLTK